MQIGITFIACSLIYQILLCIVYFSKKKIKVIETKLYGKLLYLNVFGLIMELMCFVTVINMEQFPLLNEICNRLYLIYFATFVSLFTIYIYIVCCKNEELISSKLIKFNKIETIIIIMIFLILLISVIFLPLQYFNDGNVVYSYGAAVDVLTTFCGIYMLFDLIVIFKNIKKLKRKKLIPLFTLLICFMFAFIIRNLNPGITLITCSFAFVTSVMYFTIENPDIGMIEQLNIARDQADKANKAKSDFLSSMSHEIRTPLNAIVGFSEAVKASSTLDEAIENANDIVEASQTLLEIVNGVLDISKIESGKLEIVNSNYNAHELFLNVSKLMQHKASEKALEYIVEIAPDIPNNLYGDYASIKKVITNLLSNAVKYTEKGYVRYSVNCVKKDDICRLIISVEDSGRGIKESQINKLFDKFQRLDEDKNTTIEGTGLGLAITKRLVELMNGQIVVQSKYGEGSKFTVTLDQRISVNQVIKTEEHIQNDDIDIHNKKILVVDDNTLNLKVASKVLESFTTNITLVDSGFECINKLNEGNTYDVILLDDMMPKLSGKETLIKLKDMNVSIPIVALTANAISGEREKYIEAGFDEYLAKPIDKKELERVLKKVISQNKVETDEVVIIEENI